MASGIKKKQLAQLAFEVPKELESIVCECLHAATGIHPTAISKPEFPLSEIAYYEDIENGIELAELQDPVNQVLQTLVEEKVLEKRPPILNKVIPYENWAESWKRHFKPLLIRGKLWILPPWSKKVIDEDQLSVVMNPGLSFGTGQHPTTRFCLQKLVDARNPTRRQSMLDLGTGSGILAIAAARLGYLPIRAVDNYPESVSIARENAKVNQLKNQITFECKDLQTFPQKPKTQWDVVCANLIDNLLIQERDRILALVKADGLLVLAGILESQFQFVLEAYHEAGMRVVSSRKENEWKSLALRFT